MATRSNIGILNEDGTVDYIYCHFDGYLEYNGSILNKHYTTEEQVRKLIALGDMSSLGEKLGEKQDFNGPRVNKDWCLVYGRDRGESNTEARKCSYVDYTREYFEAFIYLFTPKSNEWVVRESGVHYWASLSDALKTVEI